jgi:hypothetical protein
MCGFSSKRIRCVALVRRGSDVWLHFEENQMCGFSSAQRIRCVAYFFGGCELMLEGAYMVWMEGKWQRKAHMCPILTKKHVFTPCFDTLRAIHAKSITCCDHVWKHGVSTCFLVWIGRVRTFLCHLSSIHTMYAPSSIISQQKQFSWAPLGHTSDSLRTEATHLILFELKPHIWFSSN